MNLRKERIYTGIGQSAHMTQMRRVKVMFRTREQFLEMSWKIDQVLPKTMKSLGYVEVCMLDADSYPEEMPTQGSQITARRSPNQSQG
jgi:hypothetical protein